MDCHARWLRRRIVATTGRRLLVESVVLALIAALAMTVTRTPISLIGPWTATIAQLWLVARLVTALAANPLNHRFLDHYTNREVEFDPQPYELVLSEDLDEEDPDPVLAHRAAEAVLLPGLGLHPLITLNSAARDAGGLDVYQPKNRLAVAVVSATTLFASRMNDGRILVTTGVLTAPHELFVVNFWPGASSDDLAARHAAGIRNLHRMGTNPQRCGPELAADLLVIEHEAFAGLGPFLGCFLSLHAKAKPHLLQTAIEPSELIRLAMSSGQGQWPPATDSSNSTGTTTTLGARLPSSVMSSPASS